jgi:hypothetical protein
MFFSLMTRTVEVGEQLAQRREEVEEPLERKIVEAAEEPLEQRKVAEEIQLTLGPRTEEEEWMRDQGENLEEARD